jgi:isoquinoline 1-oxidoreductase subunit alpha
MPTYKLNINGASHSVEVDEDTPLLWVLRDQIELVGTKFGCGIGQCGACTVHINGEATKSCVTPISTLEDKSITTIEGLSKNGNHPVQEAWKEVDVPQCGYCQSGQIMTASALLEENAHPTRSEIREAMSGNICRCGSYNSIEKAVEIASKK